MTTVLDSPVNGADIARPLLPEAQTDPIARTMQDIVRNGARLDYADLNDGNGGGMWLSSGYITCTHGNRPEHEEFWTAVVFTYDGAAVVVFSVLGVTRCCDRIRTVLVPRGTRPTRILLHPTSYDGRSDGEWTGAVSSFGGKWFDIAEIIAGDARRGLRKGKLVKRSMRAGRGE